MLAGTFKRSDKRFFVYFRFFAPFRNKKSLSCFSCFSMLNLKLIIALCGHALFVFFDVKFKTIYRPVRARTASP